MFCYLTLFEAIESSWMSWNIFGEVCTELDQQIRQELKFYCKKLKQVIPSFWIDWSYNLSPYTYAHFQWFPQFFLIFGGATDNRVLEGWIPLLCAFSPVYNGFPRFTCNVIPAGLLAAGMASEPFRSLYLRLQALVGLKPVITAQCA